MTGQTDIESSSNEDTLTFEAGDNISLSSDSESKKITISAEGQEVDYTKSGWSQVNDFLYLTDSGDSVGIGTTSPSSKFHVVGNSTFSGIMNLSGVTTPLVIASNSNNTAGLKFVNLTSSSPVGVGGGKVLSVDSAGNVILVTDESGAVDLDDVLPPGAQAGATLYFDGTTWGHTTNLFHDGGKVGISTDTPEGRLHVFTNDASTVGLTIQGDAGQTANLLEWKDSDGNLLSFIDENGVYNGTFVGDLTGNVTGSVTPTGFTAGSIAFAGTGGVLSQDNSNLFWNDASNRLGIGTSSPYGRLDINGGELYLGRSTIPNQTDHPKLFATTGSGIAGSSGMGIYAPGGINFTAYTGNAGPRSTFNHPLLLQPHGVFGSHPYGLRIYLDGTYGSSPKTGLLIDSFAANTLPLIDVNSGSTNVFRIQPSGNVGIGTNDPNYPLDVNGNIRFTGSLIIGNGASSFSQYENDTRLHGTSGIRLTTWNSGLIEALRVVPNTAYVGIGTIAPDRRLDVLDASNPQLRLTHTDGTVYTDLQTTSAGELYINPSGGNVGIGTSDPSYKLDIANVINAPLLRVGNHFTVDSSSHTVNATNRFVIGTNNGPTNRLYLDQYEAVNGIHLADSTNIPTAINYIIAGDDFIVKKDGSVGIGTSSPTSKLTVYGGNLTFDDNRQINFGASLRFLGQSGNGLLLSGGANSDAGRLYINNLGIVGIGTSSPAAKFNVNGSYAGNALAMLNETGSNDIFTASASGTTRFVIKNDGKVGIGTTSPEGKLGIYYTLPLSGNDLYGINSYVSLGSGLRNYGAYFRTSAGQNNGSDTLAGVVSRIQNTGGLSLNGVSGFKVDNLIQGGGSSITNLYGFRFLPTIGTDGSIGTTYGLYVDNPTGTGTVTNSYGIYIADQTMASNNKYAIYTDGSTKSYFGGNVGIGTTSFGTDASKVLALGNGTAPSTSIADGVQLWAEDEVDSSELKVRDEAGNITTLSPHNFSLIGAPSEPLAWSYYSKRGNLAINADMTKALRLVEAMSGEKLIHIEDLATGEELNSRYKVQGIRDNNSRIVELDQELQTIKTEIDGLKAKPGEGGNSMPSGLESFLSSLNRAVRVLSDKLIVMTDVVFEKSSEFLATVTFRDRVVYEDRDRAGFAVIKSGDESVRVSFEKAYEHKPVINLTAESSSKYWIESVDTTGFTIKVATKAESDVTIHWTALAITDPVTVESAGNGTVAGAESEEKNEEEEESVEPAKEASGAGSLE